MTNSQCIEVAEKLWGWTLSGPAFKDFPKLDLESECNSWSGFGRTVEAMADRKWTFNALCVGKPSMVQFISTEHDNSPFPKHHESLIEATHLSALEAIKSP